MQGGTDHPHGLFSLIAILLHCEIDMGGTAKCHLNSCSEKSSMLSFQARNSSNLSYSLGQVNYY